MLLFRRPDDPVRDGEDRNAFQVHPDVQRVRRERRFQQAEDDGDRRPVVPSRRPGEKPFSPADLPDQGQKRLLPRDKTEDLVGGHADPLIIRFGGEPGSEQGVRLPRNGDVGGTVRFRSLDLRFRGTHYFQCISTEGFPPGEYRDTHLSHTGNNYVKREPGVSPPPGTFLVHFRDAGEECPRPSDGAEGGTRPPHGGVACSQTRRSGGACKIPVFLPDVRPETGVAGTRRNGRSYFPV